MLAIISYHNYFTLILFVRFDISAVHPQSKMPGTYTEVPYCRKATSKEVTLKLYT